jgi:hypothetical protein
MLHWLAWFLGMTSATGAPYLAWSGFASVVEGLGQLSFFLIIWKLLNCHADGCWRIGWHHVAGTHYRVCRRCHAQVAGLPVNPSVDEIRQAHEEAMNDNATGQSGAQ